MWLHKLARYSGILSFRTPSIKVPPGGLPFSKLDLCGCVLTQLGSPWVAHRVCAMPQCVSKFNSKFMSFFWAEIYIFLIIIIIYKTIHSFIFCPSALFKCFIIIIYSVRLVTKARFWQACASQGQLRTNSSFYKPVHYIKL